MINNDILRSLRNILDIRDQKVLEIVALTGGSGSLNDLTGYLSKEEDSTFIICPDRFLAHFLDGLIIYKRGVQKDKPSAPFSDKINNNLILKKLRVAFELKEEDILSLLKEAGFEVSPSEISAFFRNENHRNYRPCGDQFLRNFLKGLTRRQRG